MLKFVLMTTVVSFLTVSAAYAQDTVTVKEDVFGENDEIGTRTVQPTVNRVYKIDNVAKKKAELEKQKQEQLNNAGSSSEQSEGLKKNTAEKNTPATNSGDDQVEAEKPYSGGYKKRSLEEIEANLKLSPQELLDKVRKERLRAQKEAAQQPLLSNKEHNQSLQDVQKERRAYRRSLTKAERRALKEEQKMLEKARRDERRNMTKAERRKIKEEMKAKEKARREEKKKKQKKKKKEKKRKKKDGFFRLFFYQIPCEKKVFFLTNNLQIYAYIFISYYFFRGVYNA